MLPARISLTAAKLDRSYEIGYLASVKKQQATCAVRPQPRPMRWLVHIFASLGLLGVFFACGPSGSPTPQTPAWPAKAAQWFERAEKSFSDLDTDDARRSIDQTLALLPNEPKVRVLAGRIALADLDYARTARVLEGVEGSAAGILRGRAFWYSGQLERAAAELAQVMADPSVRDPWVEGAAYLARNGAGRQPFLKRGDRLAVVSMPRLENPGLVLPIELNGQPVYGLISTSRSEVVLDSSSGDTPSWVSMRFGGRVEVKDVPAFAEDLSSVAKRVGLPIKVLLGAHLLRHLNVTFDYLGRQFLVRDYPTPAPPLATKIPLRYLNGGSMAMRAFAGDEKGRSALTLLIESRSPWSVALQEEAWKRSLAHVPKSRVAETKEGKPVMALPEFKLGTLTLQDVPALAKVEFGKPLQVDPGIELDGIVGSGLIGGFRVSLTEDGRGAWLEDFPLHLLQPRSGARRPQGDAAKPPRASRGEKVSTPDSTGTPLRPSQPTTSEK